MLLKVCSSGLFGFFKSFNPIMSLPESFLWNKDNSLLCKCRNLFIKIAFADNKKNFFTSFFKYLTLSYQLQH